MVITVERNQNIFDLAIQFFGGMEFASNIINDNLLEWSAPLTVGQELTINNEGLGNEDIKEFFELSEEVVQNGFDIDLLTVTFDNTQVTFDSGVITFDSD